ncbi:MAG: putative DNA-binding domain-containing protein [Saccharospirillaceae bacterium]|nr:putative DNA-binding domain-containing protein [Saccharospirillaceae bacterium]MCD8532039.1 putative DNA-binding domain-containing protein [Saccharospirillaceae bacterium]
MPASEKTDHLKLQYEFAAHLRNPQQVSAPQAIDERRLDIYRGLFFNNLKGFLDTTFPVCAEVLGEERWQQLAREFFACYRSQSPYFLEIPREFLSFLETHYQPADTDPAYFYELAHYEWLELALDIAEVDNGTLAALQPALTPQQLADGIPLLTLAEGFLYQYPVHEISLQNRQPVPKPTALIVYRAADDAVRFIETNPFTLQLLALLKEQTLSGYDAVCMLLQQAGMTAGDAAIDGGMTILQQWAAQGLIAGVKAPLKNPDMS